MATALPLEKIVINQERFLSILRKYKIQAQFCGYSGMDSIYNIYARDSFIQGSSYQDSISTFLIRDRVIKNDGPVVDLRINSGPGNNLVYITESSRLKKIFEQEGVPFTDERNIQQLKEAAAEYARRLLKDSKSL